MRKARIIKTVGGIVAAMGFCVCVYALAQFDFSKAEQTVADSTAIVLFVGLLGVLIGLVAFLLGGMLGRDPNSKTVPAVETIQEVHAAWHDPRVQTAAGLFIFYGILGLIWGFAIVQSYRPTWADAPQLLAWQLPHLFILITAVYFARKRGRFLGLTASTILTAAIAGFALPIAFFLLT